MFANQSSVLNLFSCCRTESLRADPGRKQATSSGGKGECDWCADHDACAPAIILAQVVPSAQCPQQMHSEG